MTMYNSSFSGAFPFSDQAYQIALAANTELTQMIPGTSANTYRVTFSWAYNANVWVGYNKTAAVPTGGTIAATPNLELRPAVMYVRGGDVLHFISGSIVSDSGFSLLQLPN